MAITLRQNRRLKSPYPSQCVTSYPYPINQWISESNLTSYSDLTCRRHGMNNWIKEQCNCVDPLSLDVERMNDFSKVKFCSVNYGTPERICVNGAREKYMNYSQVSDGSGTMIF